MTDHEERLDVIRHKKIAQGQKDLGRKCHCGIIRAHHTAVQANTCKKTEGEHTMVKRMTPQQIQDMRQMKI